MADYNVYGVDTDTNIFGLVYEPVDDFVSVAVNSLRASSTNLLIGSVEDGEVFKRNGTGIDGSPIILSVVSTGQKEMTNDTNQAITTLTPDTDKNYFMLLQLDDGSTIPSVLDQGIADIIPIPGQAYLSQRWITGGDIQWRYMYSTVAEPTINVNWTVYSYLNS